MDELLRQAVFHISASLSNIERRLDAVLERLESAPAEHPNLEWLCAYLKDQEILDDLEMRAYMKEALRNRGEEE